MSETVNKIRNARFAQGKSGPTRWVWSTDSGGARWRRPHGAADPGGVEMIHEATKGASWWSQTVSCAKDKYVRLDAVVTCALTTDAPETGGFVLSAQAYQGDEPLGELRFTPALLRAGEPVVVRSFFKVPQGAKQLKVSVGIVRARGAANVHEVRAMPMIEPEEAAHVLAIPPPPHAVAPPRAARRILIASERAEQRTLTTLLRGALGADRVTTMPPNARSFNQTPADAVLLPDDTPPQAIRSLKTLLSFAKDRIVVISLPAFAALAGDAVKVRRVEQEDDPLCARIRYAGWMTRGFALDDTFTFAWEGDKPGGYVHRQLIRSPAFKAFQNRYGFETFLDSLGNQDATSDRPVALFRQTPNGALFVFDVEPIERTPSTMAEPVPPLHLLLTMLGHGDTGLGQFMVPAPDETVLREIIREAYPRFRSFIVHDEDAPADEVTEQLVTIGRDDESFGLPLTPKPLILVRSGLTSEDSESVYGSFLWFKQLIRPAPYECPYAAALGSRFRLAWIPCAAPWSACQGWRRRGAPPRAPMDLDIDGGSLSAVIDVVSRPVNRVRVVLPERSETFDRIAAWFPRLHAAFARDRFFAFAPPPGASGVDRDAFAWRYVEHDVEVCADAEAFREPALQHAIQTGADVIRLEVPGFDADFPALSIHRTNVTATALEHVIGLHYGLIAVNRHLKRVHFDGFTPLAPGEALIVNRQDISLTASGARAG